MVYRNSRADTMPGARLSHNHRRIYQLVRTQGPFSRADLTRVTNLTFPSISRLVTELLELGFFQETKQRRGGMGKPPTDLALKPDHAFALGLSFENDHLDAVVIDAAGTVPQRTDVPTASGPFIEVALAVAETMKAEVPLVGIGVTREGEPLTTAECEVMVRSLRVPVVSATRAAAGAILERYLGVAQSLDSFVYLDVASSVSSAVMIGERLLAHATQFRDLVQVLGGELEAVAAQPLAHVPGLASALLAAQQLLRPQAVIVGGNVLATQVDELASLLRDRQLQDSTPVQLLNGIANPDRPALAAATLALHALFAVDNTNPRS